MYTDLVTLTLEVDKSVKCIRTKSKESFLLLGNKCQLSQLCLLPLFTHQLKRGIPKRWSANSLLSLSIKAFVLTSCDQKHGLPAHPTKECQTKYIIKMVKAHQKASLQQVLQLSGSSREPVRSSRDFTYLLFTSVPTNT